MPNLRLEEAGVTDGQKLFMEIQTELGEWPEEERDVANTVEVEVEVCQWAPAMCVCLFFGGGCCWLKDCAHRWQ